MKPLLDDLLNADDYTLSQRQYEELCEIRDKLMLLTQLTGTATSLCDSTAMLFIRRALLGRLFADMSFQMNGILTAAAGDESHRDCMHAH